VKSDPIQKTVKSICANLKAERERQGISQQKLSELAGISRTGLRHIESVETSPTLYSVLKLAEALNISPQKILAGAKK
jgi:transcriptional regulator with XRE-family HTH domain